MSKQHETLRAKRKAYRNTFYGDGDKPHPAGIAVLADLKRFCRVNRGGLVISPVSKMTDPYATAYQAGLRDAFERIRLMLAIDDTTITEDSNHVQDQTETM